MNGMDVSLAPVWYRETELVRAFDIATTDCIIGRVKVGGHWDRRSKLRVGERSHARHVGTRIRTRG